MFCVVSDFNYPHCFLLFYQNKLLFSDWSVLHFNPNVIPSFRPHLVSLGIAIAG